MGQKRKISVKTMALVGVLSALVFVASMFSIPIGETARIHLGNIMCLLFGLVFGPWVGGVSAGLGSMLYDFTDPRFMPEFWITFIMKFAMAFVTGKLARKMKDKSNVALRYVLPAVVGQVLYIVLYLGKSAIMQHYVMGNPWDAVALVVATNAVVSCINGLISVTAAVLLAPCIVGGAEKLKPA